MKNLRVIILKFRIVAVLTIVLIHQVSAVYILKEKIVNNPFDIGASLVSFISQIVPSSSNTIDVSDTESEAPLQSSSEMEDEIPHFDFFKKIDVIGYKSPLKQFISTINFLLIPQDFVELHSPPPDLA